MEHGDALNTMNSQKASRYAPVVLRLGLVAVYIWFGVSQIVNSNAWTGLVPGWATGLSGMSAGTIVQFNGWFELVAGTLLAVGIYVRIVAGLLFLHLLVIVSHLGATAIGVRDFGLSMATLAIVLHGDDWLCCLRKNQGNESMGGKVEGNEATP